MNFCSKCLAPLTHNEMLAKSIKEALGASCNQGYGRTVWRKQTEHCYCTFCKDEYKSRQEQELSKLHEREMRTFKFVFIPLGLVAVFFLMYSLYMFIAKG